MYKFLPAVAATMVAADLPVIEVSLAGSAFSAMEKTRENMENNFVAQYSILLNYFTVLLFND